MSSTVLNLTKDSVSRYNDKVQAELQYDLFALDKMFAHQNEILSHINDDSIQHYQNLYDLAVTGNKSELDVLQIETRIDELKREAAQRVFENLRKQAKTEMGKIYDAKFKQRKKIELLDLQIEMEQGIISEEKFITLSDSIINRVDKSPVTDANAVALMIAYRQKMSDKNLKDQAIVQSRPDSLRP